MKPGGTAYAVPHSVFGLWMAHSPSCRRHASNQSGHPVFSGLLRRADSDPQVQDAVAPLGHLRVVRREHQRSRRSRSRRTCWASATARDAGSSSAVGSSATSRRGSAPAPGPPRPLLLAAGQLLHELVGLPSSPSRPARRGPGGLGGRPDGAQRDLDVLGRAEQRHQPVALEHDGSPRAGPAGPGEPRRRRCAPRPRRCGQPGQDRQQAGLARPGRAGHREALPRPQWPRRGRPRSSWPSRM